MATVVGASSTAAWGSAGSTTPPLPAGWAAGDVLVALAGARNAGGTFGAPAGWTQRAVSTTSAATCAAVYTKTATAGEADPTFTTGISTQPSGATIVALRGVDEASVVAAMGSGTGTTIAFDDVTTPADGSVVLLFDFEGDDNAINVQPSGYTLTFSETTLIGSDAGLHAWSTIQATAGPTGSPTATMSGSDARTRATVAFAPSGAATPATVTPPPAVSTWSGAAQVAAAATIAAAAALASFTGGAQVTAAATIAVPAAVVTFTGPTGVVAAPATVAPPPGIATWTAAPPTVAAGSATPATITPPPGVATYTGGAKVTTAATVSPPAARATWTGAAQVTAAATVDAPAAVSSWTGGTVVTAAATIQAPPGVASFTAEPPAISSLPRRDLTLTYTTAPDRWAATTSQDRWAATTAPDRWAYTSREPT